MEVTGTQYYMYAGSQRNGGKEKSAPLVDYMGIELMQQENLIHFRENKLKSVKHFMYLRYIISNSELTSSP